jgi:UDP-N-acetylglucosamine acyltransferase
MAYSHVAHDSTLGSHIIFANGASLAGHVEVGDYAILGGFTLVHQFCVVGAHALTGIGTVCLKDVPPYLIVAGNPSKTYGVNVRGLRRRKFSEESISDLKSVYKRLFRSRAVDPSISPEDIASGLSGHHAALLETFIARSDRGVIR